ncbi:MAG: hypothetical protein V3U84_03225 [Thiotrichaceae bacterium]
MLSRDEIKKRLKGIDPQLCVAFAARCSLRVLPLLVANHKGKEYFGYWDKEKRPDYVLALLTAQQVSIIFSAFGRENNIDAYAARADAADAAYAAYAPPEPPPTPPEPPPLGL